MCKIYSVGVKGCRVRVPRRESNQGRGRAEERGIRQEQEPYGRSAHLRRRGHSTDTGIKSK